MALENEEWLFVREAVDLIQPRFEYEGEAETVLLRRLSVGTLLAWETGAARYWRDKDWAVEHEISFGEGPIPKAFWEHFLHARDAWHTKGKQAQVEETWATGDFSFSFPIGDWGTYHGYAHGVLVHRSGIADILGEKRQPGRRGANDTPVISLPAANEMELSAPPAASRRGRLPTYDWNGALAFIAALAHGNDGLYPDTGGEPSASHIARLMETWFISKCEKAPSDSELRKYAGKVLAEINALKLSPADKSASAA